MIKPIARREPPAEAPGPAGTWIQITFTLDPEHYRTLRGRAEEEHRTLSGLVRENVLAFLEEMKTTSQKRKSSAKQNTRDLS